MPQELQALVARLEVRRPGLVAETLEMVGHLEGLTGAMAPPA